MRDIGVNGGMGWIHAFDALETARASLRNSGRYATV
jgi:hypothetical protein